MNIALYYFISLYNRGPVGRRSAMPLTTPNVFAIKKLVGGQLGMKGMTPAKPALWLAALVAHKSYKHAVSKSMDCKGRNWPVRFRLNKV